jgi:hypothetical protein
VAAGRGAGLGAGLEHGLGAAGQVERVGGRAGEAFLGQAFEQLEQGPEVGALRAPVRPALQQHVLEPRRQRLH